MKAFFIALAAWLALIAPVAAQTGSSKNTTQLIVEVGQEFPDNNLGLITPFNARQFQLDLLASTPNFSTTGTFTAAQAFNGGATAPTRSPGDSTTNVATTAFVTTGFPTNPNTWTALQTFDAGVAIVENSVNWTATTAIDGAYANANNFPKSAYFGNNAVGLYSSFTGAADVPSSATLLQTNGLSGYCRTASTTTLCVGSFGAGLTNAAGASAWGGNFVATNSPTTSVVNGSGFNFSTVNALECDTNIIKVGSSSPSGAATCLLISSGSETQPTGNYYGILLETAGAPLKSGIAFQDAVVSNFAIEIGSSTTGNGADSMPIVFETRESGGTPIAGGIFLDALNNLTTNVSFVSTGATIQNSPATGASFFNIAPQQTAQLGILQFFDGATLKWQVEKQTSNNFALIDTANSGTPFSVSAAGAVSLGEAGKSVTITGSSFVATGLVTNADLVNPSTTVNGQTCTLGSTCSITAAAGIVVGTTTVTGTCTSGFTLFNNGGVVGCQATGGGSVSVSGTPTNGQMAQWTNSTTIQGIAVTGTGSAVLATSPSISGLTVTSSFTATGLVTNADLANSTITAGGATCTLGSSCDPGIVAATTAVTGTCTNGFLLYNNAGVLGCQAAAGGGNVSNTGTPTNGQIAQWTNATTIQGISTVPLTAGGTAANLTASNGGIFYSTAAAGAILAGIATAGLPLLSGASAAPTWAAITYPASATSGGVPFFSSSSVMQSSGALGASCIVIGGGAGAGPSTASATCPTVNSSGAVAITNTSTTSSPITGALTVAGGLGVAGSLYAGGSTNQLGVATNGVSQFIVLGPNSGANGGAFFSVQNAANNNIILVGNRSAALASGTYDATPTMYGTGAITFYSSTLTVANYSALITTFATAATSTTTGTLQVQGGIAASAASWHAGLTVTGVFNINAVSGAGAASKYVCADSSGNVLIQTAAC